MANDDTLQGAPLKASIPIPPPRKETGVNDDNMGIVFQNTKAEVRPKLNMDAPLTAPQGQTPQPKRRSLLTTTDDVFDVGGAFHGGDVEAGTIVTDRRHKHLGFGAALVGAFNEWYSETSAKLQHIKLPKRKEPTTITAPEERKEIIKQAALNTKQVPRDDHAIVIEKFKTLSHDAERIIGKPFPVSKPMQEKTETKTTVPHAREKDPVVQHTTLPTTPVIKPAPTPPVHIKEDKTLDLRSIAVAPKIEHRIEKNVSDFVQKAPAVSPTPKPAPVVTPHVEPVVRTQVHGDVAPRVNEHSKVTLPPITPAPKKQTTTASSVSGWSHFTGGEKPETAHTQTAQPPESLPTEGSMPQFVTSPTPKLTLAPIANTLQTEQSINQGVSFPYIDTVTLVRPEMTSTQIVPTQKKSFVYVLIILLVIIIGVASGIGAAIYVSKKIDTTSNPAVNPVMSSFFSVDSITPMSFESARPLFMKNLESALSGTGNGIVQVSLTKTDATGKQIAIPETAEVFATLAPHMDSRFLRALDSRFMIGSVTTESKASFIMLRSNSFDTAFAGMLDWEPFIAEDLAPLFPGIEDTQKSTTRKSFTDALTNNKSIRILYDNEGRERMMYAFVNNNTIVITATTEALSAIIARMQ